MQKTIKRYTRRTACSLLIYACVILEVDKSVFLNNKEKKKTFFFSKPKKKVYFESFIRLC